MKCIAPKCPSARAPGSLFCRSHEGATAAQRGGWISAERRRRVRGGGVDVQPLDASNIARRLWVGSKPPFDRELPEFDVLVLCAEELQPERIAFSKSIVRCPIPDGDLTNAQITRVMLTARTIGNALLGGRRVLVTCQAGINRSALVAALALGFITKMSGEHLIVLLRQKRPGSLSNPAFRQLLRRFIGDGRGAR